MKIRFTELSDRLKYPAKYRAQLSMIHSDILAYADMYFNGTSTMKQKIVAALNATSYYVLSGEDIPDTWNPDRPLDNIPEVSMKSLRSCLGPLYITSSNIIWDVSIKNSSSEIVIDDDGTEDVPQFDLDAIEFDDITATSPDDLLLDGPAVPRIDVNKIWMSGVIDGRLYCIYTSLPEVPTTQSEVSATTDIKLMTTSDFMKMFPNRVLYTRPAEMYAEYDSIEVDPVLGAILPIKGFTKKQLINNIIQYPYLANIVREGRVDGARKQVPFYTRIEIDGQLYKTVDVWNDIPEMKGLPKNKAIMQEYVVRRYLLERDVKHMEHKYEMFGTLDPYLTLFMPTSYYIEFGHKAVEDIAKQCVLSRISYKRSRNPVIRRLNELA